MNQVDSRSRNKRHYTVCMIGNGNPEDMLQFYAGFSQIAILVLVTVEESSL